MIKAVELAAIIGVSPAIAMMDMREAAIRTACPVDFAYEEAERIAEEYAGLSAFVSFAPERWLGECHLELEGEILNAVPHFDLGVAMFWEYMLCCQADARPKRLV